MSEYLQVNNPPEANPPPGFSSQPAPAKRKHTGRRETEIVIFRESLPRGGSLVHEIVIETDGFGHFRVTNMHEDHFWHESREDAIDAALSGPGFVGSVQHVTDPAELAELAK